jgi:two-component system, NarL family, response regulator NreC
MVSVVLADDHVVVRQGLCALLESDPNVVVVGEASNGLEAVDMVTRRKPTVLITDLMMPGLDGLAIAQKLSRLKLNTQVIILSMYGDQAYVLTAFNNGAAGYVLKESCGAELFQAIREIVAGRRYISPGIAAASIGSFSSMGTILQQAQAGSAEAQDKLTVREREILRLLIEGGCSSDIASRLKISSRKVESYRANCMKKLGLSTHEDLIRYAVQRGSFARDEPRPARKSRNTSRKLK